MDGHDTGTTITVHLARAESSDWRNESAGASKSAAATPEQRTFDILLVEDNEDIRTPLASRLQRMGHKVTEEDNGTDGIERAVSARPEVAVIDIGLPGADGYEVARRIRESVGDEIYLIAVTGYGQPEDRQKALDAGFDYHLAKPVTSEQLQEIFERM